MKRRAVMLTTMIILLCFSTQMASASVMHLWEEVGEDWKETQPVQEEAPAAPVYPQPVQPAPTPYFPPETQEALPSAVTEISEPSVQSSARLSISLSLLQAVPSSRNAEDTALPHLVPAERVIHVYYRPAGEMLPDRTKVGSVALDREGEGMAVLEAGRIYTFSVEGASSSVSRSFLVHGGQSLKLVLDGSGLYELSAWQQERISAYMDAQARKKQEREAAEAAAKAAAEAEASRAAEEAIKAAEESSRAEEESLKAEEASLAAEKESREEASRAEASRAAEAESMAEVSKAAEESRKAEEASLAAEKESKAEASRTAEEASREAEEASREEASRAAEEASKAEESQKAAEEAAVRITQMERVNDLLSLAAFVAVVSALMIVQIFSRRAGRKK